MHRHASLQFPDFKVERFLQLFLQAFHAVKAFLFLFFFHNLLLCLLLFVIVYVDVFLLFPFWRPPGRRNNDRMHLVYTACVCALLLDFFFTSSSSRCANKTKVVSGFCFLTAGTKSVFCCFLKSKKNASIFVLFKEKKTSSTRNTHSLFAYCIREKPSSVF